MKNTIINNQVQSKMNNLIQWVSYYRANIHRFVEDYFNIKLKLFQKIIIKMMDCNMFFLFWAARGIGKTFLIAVYCCARCILYPRTHIVVASGSRDQANLVIDKIINEIKNIKGCYLLREIADWKLSPSESYVKFHNGSFIEVCTSNDHARGHRCQILVVDEFRLVDKDLIQDVLQPFLAVPRQPAFLETEKYRNQKEKYLESNKEIYMSSAYYKAHWSYDFGKMYLNSFLHGRDYFICGLPYQLALEEGLTDKKQIMNKMQEEGFSPTKWAMERECIFFGESDSAFFNYNDLDRMRILEVPIYTQDVYNCLNVSDKKYKYPLKKAGEIRVLTVDIATMGGKANDATAIFMIQCEPIGKDQFRQYRRNVLYANTYEGGNTAIQALQIRRLYEELECDYLVIDANGNGIGVYDLLVRDILDKERLLTYNALSCINSEVMAERGASNIVDYNAPKVIYAVKANAQFNSDCATMLRDDFKQGKIRLLLNDEDGERLLKSHKWFYDLDSKMQTKLLLPYVHTHLLIDEMVNLESDIKDNNVRLKEQPTKRKDRYSAISYGNYFIKLLERKLVRPQHNYSNISFKFRRPQIMTM